MLREPGFDYPATEGKSYVCAHEGSFHAYLDRDAAVTLALALHWFYDQQPGEEIDVTSDGWPKPPGPGKPIGYCEFNLAPDHFRKKQGKNILKEPQPNARGKPHGIIDGDRLDYFVSPHEVKTAYEAVAALLQVDESGRSRRAVTIFGTLTVHLVGS
jgi:hypothetical protein